MNNTFKKSNKIELDSNWYLSPDSDNGVILTFNEIRQRDKIEKINGKKVKTGEVEDYLFEDKYYTPRIVQALRIYADKTLNTSTTLQEILEKEDKILQILEKIDNEFQQFG